MQYETVVRGFKRARARLGCEPQAQYGLDVLWGEIAFELKDVPGFDYDQFAVDCDRVTTAQGREYARIADANRWPQAQD